MPTVEARDDLISDANTAMENRPLKPGVQAFVGPGDEVGPTVVRIKFTLTNLAQAVIVWGLVKNAGDNRGAKPGSWVRVSNEDGSRARDFTW